MTRQNHSSRRPISRQAGIVAAAPLAVVALAALLLSACHSTPTLAAKAAAAPDVVPACTASCPQAPSALQPFDEHFYTAPPEDVAIAD